jgi:hypothetical protein
VLRGFEVSSAQAAGHAVTNNERDGMKKTLAMLLMMTALTGCTGRTAYGECIGAFDEKKPELEYKMSTMNLVVATIFLETIFVPVVVVAEQTYCPVGAKKPAAHQ